MIPLRQSITAYEDGLRATFGADLSDGDLKRKHKRMRESAFLFLRATCWRWAQSAGELCPGLMTAPAVGSVGDAHAGNFGLWRDGDARLVWGVNDFDEAAVTPYTLDLVRLCASLLLADRRAEARSVASAVLAGYRRGLATPEPFVLEREHLWLRDAFAASDRQREDFWQEIEGLADEPDVPAAYRAIALAGLPPDGAVRMARRSAGAGSLGRPRFVAHGRFLGGPMAREVKGRAPSCWPGASDPGLAARLIKGPWRAPDPFLAFSDAYVLRRLAPNSRKLKFGDVRRRLGQRLHDAMGADLGAVHAQAEGAGAAIEADLKARRPTWLPDAATRVATWTEQEFEAYRG